MTFAGIPSGASVFFDANSLVYHFTNDSKYGAACTQLVERAELQQVHGFTSTHVQADVAHRIMTIQAIQKMSWPVAGIAARLRKHHSEIAQLSIHRQAILAFPKLNIRVLPITQPMIESATLLSQQLELLTGDALIVAMMQQHGISIVASLDRDFDRVPGITRYGPV